MKWKFFFLIFFSQITHANIEIQSYKGYSWNNDWNKIISAELKNEEYGAMVNRPLDEEDLRELNCPGFNNTTESEEKIKFWIVFFSALVRAESAFNPNARAIAPKGGHGNYGLVQLSKQTARKQCGLVSLEDIRDPAQHLRCAVKLMNWQITGAPVGKGKKMRPDLEGQLFGRKMLLWGPLRQNDKRGRKLLVSWFKNHVSQMPFCQI